MIYRIAWVLFLACIIRAHGAQPDLIIWAPSLSPKVQNRTFTTNECEVIEGCAQPGARRLLLFSTETRNIGAVDLVLGSPTNNPLFEFAPCHRHFHFRDFAGYRLADSAGRPVALGVKVGFCLEDVDQFDSSASSTARYDCEFQGIQAGWADIYGSSLPCQWVDITATAPGIYNLIVEVDPENRLAEGNETNNVASGFVVIDSPCTTAPTNDGFASAQALAGSSLTVIGANSCGTREGGEPRHAGSAAEHSVWYRWTAPYSGTARINTIGSSFDTLLAVYRGSALNGLSVIASNDDIRSGVLASEVTFAVMNGEQYYIAVDGWNGGEGGVALNINPAGNDRFTNCLPLSGVSGRVLGINSGAGSEAFEPAHAGMPAGRSLWYCWVAPTNGPFRFHTRGSSFNTRLGIYRGTAVSNLVEVAANDDGDASHASAVLFQAVEGQRYFVAVTGATEGVAALAWELAERPRIASITREKDGYQLVITGRATDRYVMEFSADLETWVNWGAVTNLSGSLLYREVNEAESGFYRIELLP